MLSRSSSLAWFVWTAAALFPLGTLAYVVKFYRKHCRSLAVLTRATILTLAQIALFLLSFAFSPWLAFFANIVALPFEYYVLDSSFKKLGIVSSKAVGCAALRLTIRDPESPPALKLLLATTT